MGELTNFSPLLPQQWVDRHAPTSLWVELHRVARAPGADSPNPPRCVDLGDVCATFVRTIFRYQSTSSPVLDLATAETWRETVVNPPRMKIAMFVEEWVPPEGDDDASSQMPDELQGAPPDTHILVVHNLQVVDHKTNLGTFVLLATPHGTHGQNGNETASKERLRTAAGLLGAIMGRNAVFEPVFDCQISGAGTPTGIITPAFENPAVFRTPQLSEDGLSVLESAAARLGGLQAVIRQRAELSLRWLYEAMHEKSGVFAFLKYWIAIETLAMPDDTNIKPVVLRLSDAYNVSDRHVREHFAIGHLAGLRGDIVHRGLTPKVDQYLLAYTEAIYVDLLAHELGVPARIAEQTLARDGKTAHEVVRGARA